MKFFIGEPMTSVSLQPTILAAKTTASQSATVDSENSGGAAFAMLLEDETDSSLNTMPPLDTSSDVDEKEIEINENSASEDTSADMHLLEVVAIAEKPPMLTTAHDNHVSASAGNMAVRPVAVFPATQDAGAHHILVSAIQQPVVMQRGDAAEGPDLSRDVKTQLSEAILTGPKGGEVPAIDAERSIPAKNFMSQATVVQDQLGRGLLTKPSEAALPLSAEQAVRADVSPKDVRARDVILSEVAESTKGRQLAPTFAPPAAPDNMRKAVVETAIAVEKNSDLEIAPMGFSLDRASTASSAAAELRPQTPAGQTEVARHVATQIAVAITSHAKGTTEIALNPEELGKVKLTLSVQDNAITLTVQAERPETGDLLRRHVDALGQEFKSMGYDDVSFAFGQSSNGDANEGVGTSSQSNPIENETDIILEQTQQPTRLASGGLDLRM